METRRRCDSGEYGQLPATVGNRTVAPGKTNVIPHEATLTLDLRNPDDALMSAAEQHLAEYLDAVAVEHGVDIASERMAKTSVVPFHPGIQDVLAVTADDLSLPLCGSCPAPATTPRRSRPSVRPPWCPSPASTAASAIPREHSSLEACGNGIDVLANAVLRLADEA